MRESVTSSPCDLWVAAAVKTEAARDKKYGKVKRVQQQDEYQSLDNLHFFLQMVLKVSKIKWDLD